MIRAAFIVVYLLVTISFSVKAVGLKTDTTIKRDTLFVVDGKIVRDKKGVSADVVFDSQLITEKMIPENVYAYKALSPVLIVTTKVSAIKFYKKRFSKYSKAYLRYLESHGEGDDDIVYVNASSGEVYDQRKNDGIKALYSLSKKKLKKVGFYKAQKNCCGTTPPQLIITSE